MPARRINEIVRGKRHITADMALRLARFFDMSPQFWLGLQMDYDLDVAQDEIGEQDGPAVLLLQQDSSGNPIHVVWGIPKGSASPAVLVTAYRPDPDRWSSDFLRRKS